MQFSQFTKPTLVVRYDHIQGVDFQTASLVGTGVTFTPAEIIELGQGLDQYVNILNPSLTGFTLDQNFHLQFLLDSQLIGTPTITFNVDGIYSSPYAPQFWLEFETTVFKFFDVYQGFDPLLPSDYALGVKFEYNF